MAEKPLLDALSAPAKQSNRGYPCGVHRVFLRLDPDERSAVQARIDELRQERDQIGSKGRASFSAKWLAEVLTDNGHAVSGMVMATHVRKACACGY